MTPSPMEATQSVRGEDAASMRTLTRAVATSCPVNLHKQGVPIPIYPRSHQCPRPRMNSYEYAGEDYSMSKSAGTESGIAELRSLLASKESPPNCSYLGHSPPSRAMNPLSSQHSSWARRAKVASISNLEVLQNLHGLPDSPIALPPSLPASTPGRCSPSNFVRYGMSPSPSETENSVFG